MTTDPAIERIFAAIKEAAPQQEKTLRAGLNRFESLADRRGLAQLAEALLTICGDDLQRFCRHYRWMCEQFQTEELHFWRTGRYRLTTQEEARRAVYDNPPFMARYMNGLLLSQLLWANHAATFLHFINTFLPANPDGFSHLDVGPGHGLFLHFALHHPGCAAAVGWDISPTSLERTRANLGRLGQNRARLELRDVRRAAEQGARFHSIIINEVLEHLEDPQQALASLPRLLHPGGRVFIGVPINSPAPDHIHLLRAPEEVVALTARSGLRVASSHAFPASGYSLAKALRDRATVSCVVIAHNDG